MRNLYELFSETESECIWFWIGPSNSRSWCLREPEALYDYITEECQ